MTMTDDAPLTPDEIARWARVPVAVAVDVGGAEGQIDPAIRPLCPPGAQPRLCALAVTARAAPPDFGAVLRALDGVGAGQVLVIDAGGDRDTAMIGDVLSGQLRRQGAAGVVCDGAVRDVATLAGWADFAVFSRWITPRGPTGAAGSDTGGAVRIGGVAVSPGDLILGDDDGLVALTPALARRLIGPARAKLAREEEWQAGLAAGRGAARVFGL